jgi:predicted nucleic acid-binding Zn ribbon protein
MSDAALTVCDDCGGRLEKQISRTGFQFKGEGWYVTDYAGKKNGGAEKSSAGESTAKSDAASKESSNSSAKDTSSKKD